MFPINQVLQGDCTRVLKHLPDDCVDLIVTDPPYGVRYQDSFGRTIANDDDPSRVLRAFTDLYRVLKHDSVCVSFYGWGQVDAFFRAWREAGFRPVGHIVWVKQYASRSRFLRYRHEQAYVLAKGRPSLPDEPLDDIQPWVYSGNADHPTQKSVEILKPLIEAFSHPADIVVDPFAGSGSTLVAAATLARRYVGIELDPGYCTVARNRLACAKGRSFPPASAEADSSQSISDRAVEWEDLRRWLSDRGHHDLARTMWLAMNGHR